MDALMLFPSRDRAFSAASSSSSNSSLLLAPPSPSTSGRHASRGSFSLAGRRGSASSTSSAAPAAAPPQVTVQLAQNPVFLYPVATDSNSFLPEVLEAEQAARAGSGGEDDTVLQGQATFTLHEATHVGAVKLVWEVACQRRRDSLSEWRARRILRTIELDEDSLDCTLEAGEHTRRFQFALPAQLPPTMCNSFERVTHTLYASLLDVAPAYEPLSPCAPPAYDICPLSIPSSSCSPSGSNTELASSPPSRPTITLTRTLSDESTSSADEDRSGRTVSGTIKSFFTGGRKVFGTGASATQQPFQTLQTKEQTGRIRSLSLRSDSSASSTASTEKDKQDSAQLPACCQPSLAHYSQEVTVLASHDVRGEVRRLNWSRETKITGLGQLESAVTSDLFVLGSSLNISLRLTGMPQTATIHAVALNMIQKTLSPDGRSTDVDEYALYHRGVPFQLFDITTSRERHQLWRGEVIRQRAADPMKDSKFLGPKAKKQLSASGATSGSADGRQRPPPIPQCKSMDIETGDSSISVTARARLPSSIISAHASSASDPLLGGAVSNGLKSRVTHRLRLEIYFSILGEDGYGKKLPELNGRQREGEVRRFWIDRSVKVGSCMSVGASLVAPTYTAEAPTASTPEAAQKSHVGVSDLLPSARVPMRAWKEEKCPEGGVTKSTFRRIPGDINARRMRHWSDTHAGCACFMREEEVRKQAGEPVNFESAAQDVVAWYRKIEREQL